MQILHGNADAGIKFDELRNLLMRLGFEERIRGSHSISSILSFLLYRVNLIRLP